MGPFFSMRQKIKSKLTKSAHNTIPKELVCITLEKCHYLLIKRHVPESSIVFQKVSQINIHEKNLETYFGILTDSQ